MKTIRLGRTNLTVSRSGFGALPIQRISFDESAKILLKAYDKGINFFDTARMYSDSEEKLGNALSGVRKNIVIATKSMSTDGPSLFKSIETSLKNLKTDYIDIFQLHNPDDLPDPEEPDGVYSVLAEARRKGMIRFIGVTNHKPDLAVRAVLSGLYDTVQYPINYLSSDEELSLSALCKNNDVGLIAMKALSGGLITNAGLAFAFMRQFENVVPIWGIQRESELDEFISFENDPPVLDEAMRAVIERDRKELGGNFCRGCGYCMPCPAGIPIPFAARMSFLLRRAPFRQFMTDEWKNRMFLINDCTDCRHCANSCPYGLDTPQLLKSMLKDYEEFYSLNKSK
jgi:uncharacterized protein